MAHVARQSQERGLARLGRQELHGEVLEDIVGALWQWSLIEPNRVDGELKTMEDFERIIVANVTQLVLVTALATFAVGRALAGEVVLYSSNSVDAINAVYATAGMLRADPFPSPP